MLNQCKKLVKFETITIFLISIFTIFRYQGLITPYLDSKFFEADTFLKEDLYLHNQHETFVYDLINFNYTNDYLYFCFYYLYVQQVILYKILKNIQFYLINLFILRF